MSFTYYLNCDTKAWNVVRLSKSYCYYYCFAFVKSHEFPYVINVQTSKAILYFFIYRNMELWPNSRKFKGLNVYFPQVSGIGNFQLVKYPWSGILNDIRKITKLPFNQERVSTMTQCVNFVQNCNHRAEWLIMIEKYLVILRNCVSSCQRVPSSSRNV